MNDYRDQHLAGGSRLPHMGDWMTSTVLAIVLGIVGTDAWTARNEIASLQHRLTVSETGYRKAQQRVYDLQEVCPDAPPAQQ